MMYYCILPLTLLKNVIYKSLPNKMSLVISVGFLQAFGWVTGFLAFLMVLYYDCHQLELT